MDGEYGFFGLRPQNDKEGGLGMMKENGLGMKKRAQNDRGPAPSNPTLAFLHLSKAR